MNCRVIPVTAYMMNVCNFTGKELGQFDKGIKNILRENNMHGKQCSDERLCLRRDLEGNIIKSLKDVHAETKVRVAYYMTFSRGIWIKSYFTTTDHRQATEYLQQTTHPPTGPPSTHRPPTTDHRSIIIVEIGKEKNPKIFQKCHIIKANKKYSVIF